ncbi:MULTISPECIES: toprim domain-containing protein [unclassified Fusobacterium]|uniref:toprim domain-containing protein n=1 Tax=unclassified Fusobacterium TaxID=2648384 RepID=UPI001B8ABDB4|nr:MULTISPECIES: toprim domain-containing protein [unclassified Fusobacterium]MBR8700472.1 DNA primase [Fusobacterium sp. DD45]MBR8710263.1 DNA primase [Fusobacterium sp. DD28]MBR8750785.1 DNA primase [Fusobacterium sp. DD26]
MFVEPEKYKKIKEFLGEYLQLKGVNVNKLFTCLDPNHEDKHPSMSYYKDKNICKCFGCGKVMNIFEIIGLEYGLTDFNDQLKKAVELYDNRELISKNNINDAIYSKKNVTVKIEKVEDIKLDSNIKKRGFSEEQYKKYVHKCFKNNKNSDYLTNVRKISQEIIDKYYIGYDENFKVKDYKTHVEKRWQAIIIPNAMGSLIVRNTNVEDSDRFRKIGKAAIFNYWELKEIKDNFFIVEGEIDALSICSAGGHAIALSSVSNIHLLMDKLKEDKPMNNFFLMLDNDNIGIETQKKLYELMKNEHLNVFETNYSKEYKDANEFLIKNKLNFEKFVKNINEFGKKKSKKLEIPKKIKSKEEYQR